MRTVKNLWASEDVSELLSSLGAPYKELHAAEKFVRKDTKKKKAVIESINQFVVYYERQTHR